jgi:hypothetical protein
VLWLRTKIQTQHNSTVMSTPTESKEDAAAAAAKVLVEGVPEKTAEEQIPDMSLLSITEGENERGIPVVKFIDDVGAFAESFSPTASAELLIGAYSELHSKFKTYETSLTQKREFMIFVWISPCFLLMFNLVDQFEDY